jgi:hypothetical protein
VLNPRLAFCDQITRGPPPEFLAKPHMHMLVSFSWSHGAAAGPRILATARKCPQHFKHRAAVSCGADMEFGPRCLRFSSISITTRDARRPRTAVQLHPLAPCNCNARPGKKKNCNARPMRTDADGSYLPRAHDHSPDLSPPMSHDAPSSL